MIDSFPQLRLLIITHRYGYSVYLRIQTHKISYSTRETKEISTELLLQGRFVKTWQKMKKLPSGPLGVPFVSTQGSFLVA